jgi:hypothetical protein
MPARNPVERGSSVIEQAGRASLACWQLRHARLEDLARAHSSASPHEPQETDLIRSARRRTWTSSAAINGMAWQTLDAAPNARNLCSIHVFSQFHGKLAAGYERFSYY